MNEDQQINLLADLERTIRVSDQSCTGYAILRDRYRRWSFILDLAILLLSAWLTAMVWVQPVIADLLTPCNLPRDIWLGLLSIFTFALSLVQLLVNWKERSNSFHQAMITLSTYLKELRPLRVSTDAAKIGAVLKRYQAITEPLQPIPESNFLKLKQEHKKKILISKFLDKHPGCNLTLIRVIVWWRGNRAALNWGDNNKPKEL
jgi:hypothetical protein